MAALTCTEQRPCGRDPGRLGANLVRKKQILKRPGWLPLLSAGQHALAKSKEMEVQ